MNIYVSVVNIFVDASHIFDLLNEHLENLKDSLLPVIIYETSRLLKKYKELNAYFINDSIAFYKNVHIGVAVDIDDGLKVLKLSDADKKDLHALERDLLNLMNKYIDKNLGHDDITGTTFTITDLSSEHVSFFMPLINTSQSAGLGVSSIDKVLQRFVLTLTFDHRVIRGKQASQFLYELKKRIETYKISHFSDTSSEKLNQIKCYRCLKTIDEDKEMKGPGLIKIINHKFEEVYICHVCLKWI
ncbi:MAG: 2-oxo acid dehydrogenase subunit E2 [Desulfobacterales bacterium]|nr:2-oxo acid dehydrogenase subunit E2 [Desulfobacterales bacterium]MBF0398810.1 2-oxo acid dehydrogenase subunit E2 [Desulfobacterales bacterium]